MGYFFCLFPFRGMPEWAQTLGELLPLTHFLRLVRGILLKGYHASEVLPHLWPMLAFRRWRSSPDGSVIDAPWTERHGQPGTAAFVS
jgi:hypothetical protein